MPAPWPTSGPRFAVTPERARALAFSEPYLDETLALMVLDHRRQEFESWDALRGQWPLRIASPGDIPYYEEKVHQLLPEATFFKPVGGVAALLGQPADSFDAVLATAERGSAWTLLHLDLPSVLVLRLAAATVEALAAGE
jgi:ABC-type amino acid transport substrate-binding protein